MRPAIQAEDSQKKQLQQRKHFSLRVNLFFFGTFVLFSVLIAKLALLQFVEGPRLQAQQEQKQNRDVTISPIRGNIFDANMFPIAYTVSSQSLYYRIEPDQKNEDYIELAKRLETVFAEYGSTASGTLSAADIIKLMDVGIGLDGRKTKKPGYTFVPRRIKSNMTKDEIAYISEHRDELPGIVITEESTRLYNRIDDTESIASQLIGYLRPYSVALNLQSGYLNIYKTDKTDYLKEEYVGFDGLELMFQDDLRGKNGRRTYPVNSRNEIIGLPQVIPPEKGHNLQLTLNKDVQLVAQRAIAEHLQVLQTSPPSSFYAMGNSAVAGYAVAMEVNSGRVIAMANYPDYDPNVWYGGLPQDVYESIQFRYTNGTILERFPDIADNKERARHPSSLVYLGSTMKPLSVLVGLNEGMFGPNETYGDYGPFVYGRDNSTINNSDGVRYGPLNAVSALANSSNTFMAAMIGNRLYQSSKYKSPNDALNVWDSYMEQFGLGTSTGSGLPMESAGIKDYLKTAKSASAQAALVLSSFGQQGKYTVLQLAQYASMLANKGKRYKPLFVDKILSYDNSQVIRQIEPELLNEVELPDQYWNIVRAGMSQVRVQGFEGVSYSFLRKTGTSEQDMPRNGRVNNAVFIALAPADRPKLAVAVVVPEGGFGSWGAAPIARRIFDAYDRYIGLGP